jgi:histidine triad (HIT) family protein
MAYKYDDQNIFAKILRGEIPNNTVYEDAFALAFHDIQPQAPTHVLVIPKGRYVTWDHMAADASDAEIAGYMRAIRAVCRELGVEPGTGGMGYRMIANAGEAGVQEVQHLHTHILSGRVLGRMVKRFDD